MKRTVKVGLIGFGTVGAGVAKILLDGGKPHMRGRDFDVELVRIADLDIVTDRGVDTNACMLTTDAAAVLDDPDIDIVVELIGGYEPARSFTLRAFENGKSIVTANKALIALHGSELFEKATAADAWYMFEASVGGGIPILRGLLNGLNANRLESVHGILNGTTNYILTGMARDGSDYDDVLKRAQKLGYAEADPTSDVSGGDALNKLVILSRLAFGANLNLDDVYCEGIEKITIRDIRYAAELGFTVKLLAIAKRHGDGRIQARVHPTLVPAGSMMAAVEDEFNAVEIFGDAVGREIFYGKGAGKMPTASAVVSDIMDIASGFIGGAPSNVKRILASDSLAELVDIGELDMRYYLRFSVADRPGVLSRIAQVFADEGISIESVIQKGAEDTKSVPIVIMTHAARERAMAKAMQRFGELDVVRGPVQLIRVEDL